MKLPMEPKARMILGIDLIIKLRRAPPRELVAGAGTTPPRPIPRPVSTARTS